MNTTTVRHSPAPWSCGEVEYTSTESPVFEIRDDDDRYVASVSDEADADLVTAAPDLLAACEACMTLLIRYENRSIAPEVGTGAAINAAHAAIAKAKGRNMNKHTPGPWKIGALESGQAAVDGADGSEVTGFVSIPDASLIAAAPDLLAACDRLLMSADASWRGRDVGHDWDVACDEAVKAIAKARGQ